MDKKVGQLFVWFALMGLFVLLINFSNTFPYDEPSSSNSEKIEDKVDVEKFINNRLDNDYSYNYSIFIGDLNIIYKGNYLNGVNIGVKNIHENDINYLIDKEGKITDTSSEEKIEIYDEINGYYLSKEYILSIVNNYDYNIVDGKYEYVSNEKTFVIITIEEEKLNQILITEAGNQYILNYKDYLE